MHIFVQKNVIYHIFAFNILFLAIVDHYLSFGSKILLNLDTTPIFDLWWF